MKIIIHYILATQRVVPALTHETITRRREADRPTNYHSRTCRHRARSYNCNLDLHERSNLLLVCMYGTMFTSRDGGVATQRNAQLARTHHILKAYTWIGGSTVPVLHVLLLLLMLSAHWHRAISHRFEQKRIWNIPIRLRFMTVFYTFSDYACLYDTIRYSKIFTCAQKLTADEMASLI